MSAHGRKFGQGCRLCVLAFVGAELAGPCARHRSKGVRATGWRGNSGTYVNDGGSLFSVSSKLRQPYGRRRSLTRRCPQRDKVSKRRVSCKCDVTERSRGRLASVCAHASRARGSLCGDRKANIANWPHFWCLSGNLSTRKTAWWAREDLNLQPDRYERASA